MNNFRCMLYTVNDDEPPEDEDGQAAVDDMQIEVDEQLKETRSTLAFRSLSVLRYMQILLKIIKKHK